MTKAVEFDTGPRFRRLLAPSISRSGDTETTYSGRDTINQIFFPYYLHSAISDPACNRIERILHQMILQAVITFTVKYLESASLSG